MYFWIAFSLFFIFLLLESLLSWLFIRGSRKNHPKLWRHAGAPTVLGNGDLVSAWPLNKYLLQKRYKEIGDDSAVNFAERIRTPFLFIYTGACFMALTVFIVICFFGLPNMNLFFTH